MDHNCDATGSTGTGQWEKARNIVLMALLLLLSYQAGLGNGRGEKTTAEYAALRSQYGKLLSEYDRAFGEYSVDEESMRSDIGTIRRFKGSVRSPRGEENHEPLIARVVELFGCEISGAAPLKPTLFDQSVPRRASAARAHKSSHTPAPKHSTKNLCSSHCA